MWLFLAGVVVGIALTIGTIYWLLNYGGKSLMLDS